MKRLSNSQVAEIKSFAKKGKSLNQIAKKMNVGKTTIYYHTRKLLGKKIKEVVIDNSNEKKIGEFIGLFAGDGSYFFEKAKYSYRIRVHLNKKEHDIIQYYKKLIRELFGKSPNLYHMESVVILEIRSKIIYNFIKSYLEWNHNKTFTVKLKNFDKLSKEFLKGFAKGLIDSDGYVRHGRKEIYFGTTSPALNKNFVDILKLINVNFKCYRQIRENRHIFYKTRLANEEVSKFVKIIEPIKANGLAGI